MRHDSTKSEARDLTTCLIDKIGRVPTFALIAFGTILKWFTFAMGIGFIIGGIGLFLENHFVVGQIVYLVILVLGPSAIAALFAFAAALNILDWWHDINSQYPPRKKDEVS